MSTRRDIITVMTALRSGRLIAAAVSLAAFITAMGVSPAQASVPSLPVPAAVTWGACPAHATDASFECAAVAVPRNYAMPSAGMTSLTVTEVPASSVAVGTLFVMPDQPGQSGVAYLNLLSHLLPAALTARFNLVAFDERGTGTSSLFYCLTYPPAEVSALPYSKDPGAPLPSSVFDAHLAKACEAAFPNQIPEENSVTAAYDLDEIRQALGLAQINYLGLGYSTVLGSVYAKLFPGDVRTMVLDGAVVGNESLTEQIRQEAPALEGGLDHLLYECDYVTVCPILNAGSFFAKLIKYMQAHPLAAPGGADTYKVTIGDLDNSLTLYLDEPSLLPQYFEALEEAGFGKGFGLRAYAVAAYRSSRGVSSYDARWALICGDHARRPTSVALNSLALTLKSKDPNLGYFAPSYLASGCTSWPAATDPVPKSLHLSSGPKVLVIGNTHDPITPLVWAKMLTKQLGRARLVKFSSYGHTWLLSKPKDTCMISVVEAYLVSRRLPPRGTTCH